MIDPFEEFTGQPNGIRRDRPRVTLNRKGVVLLNTAAYRELQEPGAVKFYYDGNERIIGMRAADIRLANSFPVRRKSENHYLIFASPLCRHYRIKPAGTILFNDIELDHTGMIKLDLKTAITVGRGSS